MNNKGHMASDTGTYSIFSNLNKAAKDGQVTEISSGNNSFQKRVRLEQDIKPDEEGKAGLSRVESFPDQSGTDLEKGQKKKTLFRKNDSEKPFTLEDKKEDSPADTDSVGAGKESSSFHPQSFYLPDEEKPKSKTGAWIALLVLGMLLVIAYLLFRVLSDPQSTPSLMDKQGLAATVSTQSPATGADSNGEQARALVETTRAETTTPEYAEIYTQAEAFRNAGMHTDAYLMHFYAAREGYGDSAFALAAMSDPNHFQPMPEVLEGPNEFQAIKWYREAEKAGVAEASRRLAMLRQQLEIAAAEGDNRARRLLLFFR